MAYSFLNLARDVLKQADAPMTFQEIWAMGVESGLDHKVGSKGKTPHASLGARLYTDCKNDESVFLKVGTNPARFWLKDRKDEVDEKLIAKAELASEKTPKATSKWKERDLHAVLSYFCFTNPIFNKGKAIYTKTIYHEKSKKDGVSSWVYPDMVGVYIPLDEWHQEVFDLATVCADSPIKIYSFELKKAIDKSNYRESFFQALSNSAWANESYLVTADMSDDDALKTEIERLSSQFGIGIIILELDDVDSSEQYLPPKHKVNLDWESINKLTQNNPDFLEFLTNIKIDFNGRKMHKHEYDDIVDDIDSYVAEKCMTSSK